MMTNRASSAISPDSGHGGSCVLGIEGGGTKTEWVLAEKQESGELRILDEGSLPAANLKLSTDEELAGLFSVLPRHAARVGVYLAGCATEDDRARLRKLVVSAWPDAVTVVGSDRDSAMAAAFRARDGVIVIAGTGAAAHGRRDGRVERAGGWGQLLGDQGGGYHLAMQGLRSVLTHFDLNDEISELAQKILRMLALNGLRDLVDWVSLADKMSVARLAPAIFESAAKGDPETRAIIRRGAEILAEFAHAVLRRLDFPDAPVCLFGGLFAHYPEYAKLFTDRLATLAPQATVSVCHESGAIGSAWLASELKEGPASGANGFSPSLTASVPAPSLDIKELAAAATEQRNPRSMAMDHLTTGELVDLFVTEEDQVTKALAACREPLCRAIEVVSSALSRGGRLFYIGAGTSGRLGVLDASEIPPTFGAPPELVQGIIAGGARALHSAVEGVEDQSEAGAFALIERGVWAGDVVCGLTASGRTPFVLGALERAKQLRARTILITCNPARHRSDSWEVEIDLPTGPELLTGSTRLKAGTATKLALNILSTCAMVRLGKVRGNSMIDVRISNEKLRDRGVRLVSEALGVSYGEALRQLEKTGWDVRACLGNGKVGAET